jgi:hypothetical protein
MSSDFRRIFGLTSADGFLASSFAVLSMILIRNYKTPALLSYRKRRAAGLSWRSTSTVLSRRQANHIRVYSGRKPDGDARRERGLKEGNRLHVCRARLTRQNEAILVSEWVLPSLTTEHSEGLGVERPASKSVHK